MYDGAKMRMMPLVSIKKDATHSKAFTQCADTKEGASKTLEKMRKLPYRPPFFPLKA